MTAPSLPRHGIATPAIETRQPIRGLLFDIDGTLFDYVGSERAAIRAWLAACGLPSDDVAADAWAEATIANFARFTSGELTFEEQRVERVRMFLGQPLDDDAARVWFDGYRLEYERRWLLFDDTVPALDELAAVPGLRLGLISNSSSAHQRRKLSTLGVLDRFDCLVCSDDVGAAKPNPAIFHAGCDALGLPPSVCAYVGDMPDIDALGAHAAGLRGIWLNRLPDAVPQRHAAMPADVAVIASLGVLLATLGIAG
jgi:putative hydrolase of the HAD superfamily